MREIIRRYTREPFPLWLSSRNFTPIYGRHFTLITKHKPLESIFLYRERTTSDNSFEIATVRCMPVSLYSDIGYRNSKHHTNTDAQSRLVQQRDSNKEVDPDSVDLFHLTQFDQLPITCAVLRREIKNDPTLS